MLEDELYTLHLYRHGHDRHAWRASLKDLRRHKQHDFSSIPKLLAFLEERTAQVVMPEEDTPPRD